MTEIVHRAFWDCLQEELHSDPPNYDHAVILLQEVKTVSVYGIESDTLAAGQGGGSTEASDPVHSHTL